MAPDKSDSVEKTVHEICCVAGVLAAFDKEKARQLWVVASEMNEAYLNAPLDKNYDDLNGESEKIDFLKRILSLLKQVDGEYVRLHD